ncbi:hypothetical protein HPG69_006033 [Diceros bicornis minor]|uniref:Uncharacterized protein n=1 Tax=Diceros bicornis minor TaxID=77932 RepID=A0A7J7EN63_DICBM|nr:hypothetical protein HPG69_006033 [Diceros bicornis minor]
MTESYVKKNEVVVSADTEAEGADLATGTVWCGAGVCWVQGLHASCGRGPCVFTPFYTSLSPASTLAGHSALAARASSLPRGRLVLAPQSFVPRDTEDDGVLLGVLSRRHLAPGVGRWWVGAGDEEKSAGAGGVTGVLLCKGRAEHGPEGHLGAVFYSAVCLQPLPLREPLSSGAGDMKHECPGTQGWGRRPPSTPPGFVAAELSTILLDAVTDKDPLVQEQVCSALCALGESQPEEALSAWEEHLQQHGKVCPLRGGRAAGRGPREGAGCPSGNKRLSLKKDVPEWGLFQLLMETLNANKPACRGLKRKGSVHSQTRAGAEEA